MADPVTSPRLGAVVLAAGASSRMGDVKQRLPLGRQPLLGRAVEALLASPVWPVVVVVGAHQEQVRPLLARHPVLIADNPAWAEGLASSLRAGVATLREFSRDLEGVVVAVCDQPAFSAAIVGRLIAAHHSSGRSIAAARYGGRLGVPALFGAGHFAALAALTGETGARELLNRDPFAVAAVDLPELAVDLDTPEDYRAALQHEAKP